MYDEEGSDMMNQFDGGKVKTKSGLGVEISPYKLLKK